MIRIGDELLVASGNRRQVFVHPDDPARCLKVAAPGCSPGELRLGKVWYKRLRPDYSYDDNHLELYEYKRVCRYVPNPEFALPRINGIVETNRGPALDEELIRNADGSIASPLLDVLAKARNDKQLRKLLETGLLEFTSWFAKNHIVVHDLHPKNVVVQQKKDGMRFVLIDGMGAYSLVPFENLLPFPVSVFRLKGKIVRFFRIVNRVLNDDGLAKDAIL